MLIYIVLISFIIAFSFLIRRDRVYLVPMILLIFSNLNGLLGWEDFALKGTIKFQDYGLVITIVILFLSAMRLHNPLPAYVTTLRKLPLYNAINVYWIYYIGLFLFSVFLQGSILWPVKMARFFFYGLIFYLIHQEILSDPLVKFEKIINCLMISTVLLGLLYIAYNLLGWNIYPKGEHETFNLGYLIHEVKRNFSGFPMFTYYFIFLFTDRLMLGKGRMLFNFAGLVILMLLCLANAIARYADSNDSDGWISNGLPPPHSGYGETSSNPPSRTVACTGAGSISC